MPGSHVGSTELFTAFEKWCAAEREDAGTPTAFGNAMKVRGFESYRSNGIRWRGVGLAARTPSDPHGRVGRARAEPLARVGRKAENSSDPSNHPQAAHARLLRVAIRKGRKGWKCLRLDRPHARVMRARTLPTLPLFRRGVCSKCGAEPGGESLTIPPRLPRSVT